nr:hypothetical protein [Kibdelosporangium sp. MJ126-NF4]CEL13469.1 hypothetical protein [Kibdelosporangium sp. MJ126-NF4]CTQ99156.1 hypothetical protein [Kibdelosporangium sp. MJ126-NF4]
MTASAVRQQLFCLLHDITPDFAAVIPTSGYNEATPHWTIAVIVIVLTLRCPWPVHKVTMG